jgi:hypothetical protein
MNPRQAARLREEWEKKGNPPCEHPTLEKETVSGPGPSTTGDYVCSVCGESGWGREWARPAKPDERASS